MGLYALYPYIHDILLELYIELPIHKFQYQSVFSAILGVPFLFILGIIMIRNESKINKFLGCVYLVASLYSVYNTYLNFG